jgi:hypothetical protein
LGELELFFFGKNWVVFVSYARSLKSLIILLAQVAPFYRPVLLKTEVAFVALKGFLESLGGLELLFVLLDRFIEINLYCQ